jgi:predicted ribosome quality control (RQC) complex YloA/Tae2 family protein
MLARKHLVGRPFHGAAADRSHPVLEIRFGPRPKEEPRDAIVISAELTGHASTLLLLSERQSERRILGALRSLPGARRDLSPGALYAPPTLPGRLDPDAATPADLRDTVHRLAATGRSRGGARLLSRCFEGVGRRLSAETLARAGIMPEAIGGALTEPQAAELLQAIRALLETPGEPCLVADADGVPVEILPFPLPSLDQPTHPAPSLSQAMDRLYSAQEAAGAIEGARSRLLRSIARQVTHREEKSARHRENLKAARGGDRQRRSADLLLSQVEVRQRGLREIEVIDAFDPEAPRVRITLDPRKTLAGNAEDLYRRARKARRAVRHLTEVLAWGEAEVRFLAEQRLHGEQAQDVETLESIEETIAGALARPGGRKAQARTGRRGQETGQTGPRRFELEGWEILAGRHSRDNDRIVTRLGRRDDYWLHARGVPGAHVLVRGHGLGEPPARILEAAARIAAHFSRARNDSRADVSLTRLRYVRKAPRLLPGQVEVTRSRTLTVRPGLPVPATTPPPGPSGPSRGRSRRA